MNEQQRAVASDLYSAVYSAAEDLANFGADERIGELEDAGSDLMNILDGLWKRVTA